MTALRLNHSFRSRETEARTGRVPEAPWQKGRLRPPNARVQPHPRVYLEPLAGPGAGGFQEGHNPTPGGTSQQGETVLHPPERMKC